MGGNLTLKNHGFLAPELHSVLCVLKNRLFISGRITVTENLVVMLPGLYTAVLDRFLRPYPSAFPVAHIAFIVDNTKHQSFLGAVGHSVFGGKFMPG